MDMKMFLFLLAAAALEVWGDARVGAGIRVTPLRWLPISFGAVLLAAYGVVVNLAAKNDPKLDLGVLLGSYVGFFAVVATLWQWRDIPRYPFARWGGLLLIVAGGWIIQRYGAVPEAR